MKTSWSNPGICLGSVKTTLRNVITSVKIKNTLSNMMVNIGGPMSKATYLETILAVNVLKIPAILAMNFLKIPVNFMKMTSSMNLMKMKWRTTTFSIFNTNRNIEITDHER